MRKTPERRYRERISKLRNGCWTWTGLTRDGRPVFKVNGERMEVRRWAWPSEPVPEYVGTSCGEERCVRPEHLTAVRSGPRPRPAEIPDEIVQFLIDNPRGHREACKQFCLTERELVEIYLEWVTSQPKPPPTRTAPRHRKRLEEAPGDGLAKEILELLNSTDEPW